MDDPDKDFRPDLQYGEKKAWQIGGAFNVMGAWRFLLHDNLSIDLLTGPMLDISFASRVKGLGLEYNNLYHTLAFDWRIGVGINICKRFRLGFNYDIRPGYQKKVNIGEPYVGFIASDRKRRDALNFSVGYRF